MAKKQTRRSISVSRTTYERLKAFCEANNISMSQLVETRVNDFLGEGSTGVTTPITPRPTPPSPPRPMMPSTLPPKAPTSTDTAGYHHTPSIAASSSTQVTSASTSSSHATAQSAQVAQAAQPMAPRPSTPSVPMTSAAARYAVEPPPPIIKPKQQDTNAPKPAEKRPDQIFTF